MQVKNIAECSFVKLPFVVKTLFFFRFLSGCFRQVLLYTQYFENSLLQANILRSSHIEEETVSEDINSVLFSWFSNMQILNTLSDLLQTDTYYFLKRSLIKLFIKIGMSFFDTSWN